MVLDLDYPELTDEAIAEARKLIGVPLRRHLNNIEVTRHAIVSWARGIGERNPLYVNDAHARYSRYGGFIAPPLWLYSVDDTMVAPKLPGIHSIYAGADWEFFKILRLGDKITVDARLTDVVEKQGQFCGRMVLQVGEVNYRNQRRELVARCISKTMRCPRKAAQERNKYGSWQKHRYNHEELLKIEDGYDKEAWRGVDIRYWEEVKEGEELAPIVRGPLTSEDMLQFVHNTRSAMTYRRFLEYRRRHPRYAFREPESGMWDSWENELLDDKVARRMGFPFAHDTGIERICLLGNLVTNWMGDDAFLVKLGAELRLPWIYGDAMWMKGKVTRKYLDGDRHLVELEIWCENQSGVLTTANGRATVELLSKSVSSDEVRLT